jgi:hypothetical protein
MSEPQVPMVVDVDVTFSFTCFKATHNFSIEALHEALSKAVAEYSQRAHIALSTLQVATHAGEKL